jgi:hemolysin activation/secretion protein
MKRVNLITLSLIASANLYGAQTPNIGTVLKEVKPPKVEKKKEVLPPLQKEDKEYKKVLKGGKKVFIRKIIITGAEHLSNKELKNIVKPYEEKKLSFNDMQKIANLISKAYRDEGYFVARAYIPMQNLQEQNRVLKIAVIEGEYGEFKLENSSFVKDSILQANLDEIKKSKVVSTKSLERGLLIINDTPGVSIKSTKITAGKEVGRSDFIIGTKVDDRINGYVIADNYGSQYTGKHRVMVGVDVNSPFKIGDKLSISGLSSQDAGLINGRFAYGFLIHPNGLRGEVSYSKTTYELGSTYKDLDALGYADSYVAKISYPYIRSNNENLEAYLTTSYNKMSDEIQATSTKIKKNTLTAKVGLEYLKYTVIYDKYTQIKITPSLTIGRLSFENDIDKQNDENGANTNGNFSKVNLDLESNIIFNKKLRWKNTVQLQYALGDKNLDGSEDMSIGGVGGVKFYPDAEESAENGYIFNTELIYSLPGYKEFNSQVGVFYDIGHVYMSKNTTNEDSRVLQDVGISYYATYKSFFMNAYLAYRVNNVHVTSEDDYCSRFMFQGGWMF